MRIEDSTGRSIFKMEDWAKLYDNDEQRHHWQEYRSAYSLADYIINRNGITHLQRKVSEVLGLPVTFERAIPEYERKFDCYGKGRVHDLGIFGHTDNGKTLFVGLEAKVDEPFGDIVRDAYLKALVKRMSGDATNAPERIERLLHLHFPEPDLAMFDIRYQLLYSTVGTLAVHTDISIFYVVVFKAPLFDEIMAGENIDDYLRFINKVGGQLVESKDQHTPVHEVFITDRRLICVYEELEVC